MSRVIAGVDIGGTTTQVVLCDENLTPLARAEAVTPAKDGGDAMVSVAVRLIAELLERTGDTLAAVGVGAAGVVDNVAGDVLYVSDSFVGWAGFRVTEELRRRLGVPAVLENDVNAFLIGEATAGVVRGDDSALGITLGTGVGGALWLDGKLFRGQHGAAGEIGHIPGFGDDLCTCGGHGHLETIASGLSISRRYAERSGTALEARDVAAAAHAGDRDAVDVFGDVGEALARGIVITSGLVDVATVVIGGGVSRAWTLFQPALEAALRREPPVNGHPPRVEQARLAGDAVAVGAAAAAWRATLAPSVAGS